MYLYRLNVDCDKGKVVVITTAENEAQAFEAVDEHLQRHFLVLPQIHEVNLVEKKRISAKAAYIVETT